MNWLQDNKFAAVLAGATIVGLVGLYFVGSKSDKKYQAALDEYNTAAGEVGRFEKTVPYPSAGNRDQKRKAIDAYRQSITSLQTAFEKYQIKPGAQISPQDFASRLATVNEELSKKFTEYSVTMPESFFSGFIAYRQALPNARATAVLDYQLSALRSIFNDLAEAGISELKNVYRIPLPEERGSAWEQDAGEIARALPVELTFSGNEKSVRNFITKLSATDQKFVAIRVIQIENEKAESPPLTTDAKFERTKQPATTTDSFSGFFSEPAPAPDAAPPTTAQPAPAQPGASPAQPAPPAAAQPAPLDTSRKLQQILGTEELRVFIRFDIMQFQPAKQLP
ncbi:MAG: Amuc_1100 family pilus-like protein [Verrucomicrobiota bacterium]